jgi:hypothetical protein
MCDNDAEGRREACERQGQPSSLSILFPRTLIDLVQSPKPEFCHTNTMNDLVEFLRTHEEAFRRYMALLSPLRQEEDD